MDFFVGEKANAVGNARERVIIMYGAALWVEGETVDNGVVVNLCGTVLLCIELTFTCAFLVERFLTAGYGQGGDDECDDTLLFHFLLLFWL